ncbi:hypothetical protein [Ornithinimicrobium cryptoxanthini]|uniref:DUF5753 domain-containing protein n=1 Tax=Ornithinimicrobium cryptoxanthini TaxID=2934161 RepID=A0ABY4YHQ5_9MICO|nr:hypothetical protein [Ornithinimicrobium cryptoxanthini]USQ76316.1 hypothetical protein NF557_17295 [Ornithinimicrobium cryptoxanthini]
MSDNPGRKKLTPRKVASEVARQVRRVPAAESVALRALTGLRESQLAREVVSRTMDLDEGVGGTVFVAAGHQLAGQGLDNVPVVILSLVDAPPAQLPDLLEEIAREQLLTGGFRPVLVVSGDHFTAVREFGWPVELVLDEATWHAEEQVADEDGWAAYLERRLQQLRRHYQAVALMPFGPEHPMTMTYLRSLGPATT